MISVEGLKKRFGDLLAVDGVSFELRDGETFGLLGPNGAGKTTTILMTIGALTPDAGRVAIDGADLTSAGARKHIGVAPQSLALYETLTGEENLRFFAGLYGLAGPALRERVASALELAGLTDRRRDRVSTYSGGMKRRLNLACAMVHAPRVVFLDEPTVGVDPQSRNHIFEAIERLAADGVTILYTTHYMEEAQRLCDRVAIMDRGKILALDTVDELIATYGGTSIVRGELSEAPKPDADLPGTLEGTTLRVETDRPLELVGSLAGKGVRFGSLHVERPDLESVFLSLTGRTLRD
jgi:ABC-2 type transport system ATP-binding protein